MRVLLVLVLVSSVVRVWSADPNGDRLYAERCSGCHGEHGGGDGPAAAALVPRPRNFRDPAYWKDRPLEPLRTIVKKGKPGTMMPAFDGVLSDAEIAAVLQVARGFGAETSK
jgi:mono/diheme cytochrome c family protein